jgi:hypothetical protein
MATMACIRSGFKEKIFKNGNVLKKYSIFGLENQLMLNLNHLKWQS